MPEIYTSTVIAPAQIALGVVSGAIVALVLELLNVGLWPLALVAFLVIAGIGVYLATVSLTVEPNRVTIGQGRAEREPRVIYLEEIVERSAARLSWPQCLGFGMPSDVPTTRLTVRPGPTLCLVLRTGELVRISTPDPAAALRR
jgi:hypothetical protein